MSEKRQKIKVVRAPEVSRGGPLEAMIYESNLPGCMAQGWRRAPEGDDAVVEEKVEAPAPAKKKAAKKKASK